MDEYIKVLEAHAVTKTYGKGGAVTQALRGISFDLYEGEFLGIMGPSGSGKTTLLNILAALIKMTGGTVLIGNRDIGKLSQKEMSDFRGKETGFIFQDFMLLDNLTAFENILLPVSIAGGDLKNGEERIKKLAKLLDIEDELQKFPPMLSGGQKQRVAAARALISDPKIILADEPTGALDSKNSKTLMDMLSKINNEGKKTIVTVTHNCAAASYCSRILFIRDGLIFHELRRKTGEERDMFYERIVDVMSRIEGGRENVL